MKKYKLELIVFISGSVVMMLELTGSRVLAPFLGTSIFVWTSLIGIILGSLSLGYYLGGKSADKKPSFEKFSLILLIAGLLIAITTVSKNITLNFVEQNITNLRLGAILATTILFAPASIFLGMVSPYAVKLKVKSIDKAGSTVGNLYALSTMGSIAGTFLSGFYLISYIGHTKLLMLLAILMVTTSMLANLKKTLFLKIIIGLTLITYLISVNTADASMENGKIIEIDTLYNNVKIYKDSDYQTLKPIIRMSLNKNSSSAMFEESDELVFTYTKFYDLAKHFNPDFEKSLMIGGAAYSYPKHYLEKFPQATIDVVEIDPALTELAKKYFRLEESPRLRVFHEDGRTFINTTKEKYDVIFGDAFKAYYSIPHQLTTIESVQKMYDALSENGIVLVNVISALEGEKSEFFRAEYHTFSAVFPQVLVFAVYYPDDGTLNQNLILAALKSEKTPSLESPDIELNQYLKQLWKKEIPLDMPILTDDFAPIDKYIMKLL
ncbi:MAG: fused MFS/spermidine synthase [bacterium]|nr:fused MFS/spermidine synthase [bacterium]